MRIVIDMQGAQTESRFRGIGRYALEFAQAVARNRGEHQVFLALSGLFPDTIEPIRAAFEGLLPQENIRAWHAIGPVKDVDPSNQARREVAELMREAFLASLKPDVIHVTSLFEGYVDDAVTSIGKFDQQTPVSVSFYDLIPLLNPDQYIKPNPDYAAYYARKMEWLNNAQTLLAISGYTRQEGLDCLDIGPERIINVSTAIGPDFQPRLIDQHVANGLRAKLGLHRPFILYTGGADERKNLPRLIEAWSALPTSLRQAHQLVLAGHMPEGHVAELRRTAVHCGLRDDELVFSGYVSDEELIQLYNLCALYVFPSWHEGFGLPALEAMACGAPVIGANTTSLPEVIGLEEAQFDPFNPASIAQKMEQALVDGSFRAQLRSHGLQQAKKFSWDETARRSIAAWAKPSGTPSRQSFTRLGDPSRKPRLAFVSPLPPERTGIADYSAELLPALSAYYDIELVVAQGRVSTDTAVFGGQVRNVAWLRAHAQSIDRVIYQIGNAPFHSHMLDLLKDIPGTVVLHDFFLSGLMAWLEQHGGVAGAWTSSLYLSHGYVAVRDRYLDIEFAKRRYPVNWHVLQHAQGLIVHSDYSRNLVRQWYGPAASVELDVIPHLRLPIRYIGKHAARKQLGMDEADFIVCSFGFLDETKLNHRLLQAWLTSALAVDKRCCLVFVGENQGGEYGVAMLKKIRESGFGDRIRITGFASAERFRQYLAAADLAVQLRTHSRGETSGTVLDSMIHALPLIVNANGSMAELDPDAVWMLPDDFSDAELVNTLETLWRDPEQRRTRGARAQTLIHTRHAPQECARRYATAIEGFHRRAAIDQPALIAAIARQSTFKPDDAALRCLSATIANNLPLPRPARRLFLDVTATCRNDLKTGIERVARSIVLALLESPPDGYRIEPVYLSDAGGVWHHRYARGYTLGLLGCPSDALPDDPIDLTNGDLMLGLDISGDMLIQAEQAELFTSYRNRGVFVYFFVHDLLPILMPLVFPPSAHEQFCGWLHAISKFDGAICPTKIVANDLIEWQAKELIDGPNKRKFHIAWSHHGADFSSAPLSTGATNLDLELLTVLAAHPSFLLVSTIEPRKGYLQVIDAFTTLWAKGLDVNLVIVGKEGWQGLPETMRRDIPLTVERLRHHPELNQRLFWLEGISDKYLEKVYAASTCLIAASYGEGFGLPLIESAQHKLPIIARDIPVFREVAGEHAYYFSGTTTEDLAQAIENWLVLKEHGRHPDSSAIPWLTWKQSAQQLLDALGIPTPSSTTPS
jgi:glycosyltransferase involved in cell wall biosynthesis